MSIESGKITSSDLTAEMLEGTHLRWSRIKKLYGKEVNSSRTKKRIYSAYMEILRREALWLYEEELELSREAAAAA
jgi:hypothetical protein